MRSAIGSGVQRSSSEHRRPTSVAPIVCGEGLACAVRAANMRSKEFIVTLEEMQVLLDSEVGYNLTSSWGSSTHKSYLHLYARLLSGSLDIADSLG